VIKYIIAPNYYLVDLLVVILFITSVRVSVRVVQFAS